MAERRYSLIVTGAGSGLRYGGPSNKIFEPLNGVPTIIHAIRRTWVPQIHQIIITTSRDDSRQLSDLLTQYAINATVIIGGATRFESVQNALIQVSPDSAAVLIHDAARPNPGQALVRRLIDESVVHDAVIPGIPVTDTIKQIRSNTFVKKTIPRDDLIAVQTPQLFSRAMIPILLKTTPSADITDEAMALESRGIPIKIVLGTPHNVKLTQPIDKLVLEALLQDLEEI